MQIKIEIDVKPEELRRFLGLPDVAGLQEDVMRFLRDKVSAAGDNFDPGAAMQGGLDMLKRTPAWRIIRTAVLGRDAETGAGPADFAAWDSGDSETPPVPRRSRRAAKAESAAEKSAATKASKKRRGRTAAAGSRVDTE